VRHVPPTVGQFIRKRSCRTRTAGASSKRPMPNAWTAAGQRRHTAHRRARWSMARRRRQFRALRRSSGELVHAGVQLSGLEHSEASWGHYILALRSEEQGSAPGVPRMSRRASWWAPIRDELSPDCGVPTCRAFRRPPRRDGEHYVINGSKTFITNGGHASLRLPRRQDGPPG